MIDLTLNDFKGDISIILHLYELLFKDLIHRNKIITLLINLIIKKGLLFECIINSFFYHFLYLIYKKGLNLNIRKLQIIFTFKLNVI